MLIFADGLDWDSIEKERPSDGEEVLRITKVWVEIGVGSKWLYHLNSKKVVGTSSKVNSW